METKTESLQEILLAIAEERDECISIPYAYSGRGMCGRRCLAVDTVGGIGQMFSAIVRYISDDNADEIAEAFNGMKIDSMGHGHVMYFPGIEFAEENNPDMD